MQTYQEFAATRKDTDPLDTIKAYRDSVSIDLLKSGQYDDALVADIDKRLFAYASGQGLLPADNPESAYLSRPDDADYRDMQRHVADEGVRSVLTDYLAASGDRVREAYGSDTEGYRTRLDESRAAAAQAVADPAVRNDALKAATLAGDRPFAVLRDAEGNESLFLSPELRQYSGNDEALASMFEANPGLDRTRIGEIRSKLRVPEGYDKPLFDIERQGDFLSAVADAAAKDPVLGSSISSLKEAADKGITGTWAETIGRIDADPGLAALRAEFPDADERRAFLEDYVKRVSAPAVNEEDVDANVMVLSTGERVLPLGVMLNRKMFDRTLAESTNIPDAQKDVIRATRDQQVSALAPDSFRIIAENRSDFTKFLDERKAQGKSNAEILDEWMSDPENYSSARSYLGGIGESLVEGFGGLFMYPAALAGNQSATKALRDLQESDAERRAYAQLFGKNLDWKYDASRLIAPVAADITATLATGGAAATVVAAKTSVRSAMRETLRTALSAGTKNLLRNAVTRRAPGASIDEAITIAGRDLANTLTRGATTSAMLGTAFNRSAGSTYVQLLSTLSEQKNPDGTPKYTSEKAREIALNHGLIAGAVTAAVTGGFSFLGRGGVESIYDGLTARQWGRIARNLRNDFDKLAPSVREGLDPTNARTLLDSVIRKSVKPLFLKAGQASLDEAGEEALDQFIGYFNQSIATGEKINPFAAAKEALYAGMLGGMLGGGVVTLNEAVRPADVGRSTEESARRSVLLDTAALAEKGSLPQTAAALRDMAVRGVPVEGAAEAPAPEEGTTTTPEEGDIEVPAEEMPETPSPEQVEQYRADRRREIVERFMSRVPGQTWKAGTPDEVIDEYESLTPATDEQDTQGQPRPQETPETPRPETPEEGPPGRGGARGGQAAQTAREIIGEPRQGFDNQFTTPEGATVELLPDGRASFIVPPSIRGQGAGNAAVERVKRYADATGTTISLDIEPLGNEPGMTRGQLADWYERRGFSVSGDRMSASYQPATQQGLATVEGGSRGWGGVVRDATKPEQMTPDEVRAKKLRTFEITTEKGLNPNFVVSILEKDERGNPQIGFYSNPSGFFEGKVSGDTLALGQKLYTASLEDVSGPAGMERFLERKAREEGSPVFKVTRSGGGHPQSVINAFLSKRPVSAEAVDSYGIQLPEGYVRQGDLYTYQPTQTDATEERNQQQDDLTPEGGQGEAQTPLTELPEAAVREALEDRTPVEQALASPSPELAVREADLGADLRAEAEQAIPGLDTEGLPDRDILALLSGRQSQGPVIPEAESPVTAELMRYGFQNGLRTFLANVAKDGPPHQRRVAKLLARFPEPRITLTHSPKASFAGAFIPSTRQILVNTAIPGPRGGADTLLHELLHAATYDSLLNPTPDQAVVLRRLERIRKNALKRAQKLGKNDLLYGLGTMDEFMTHFLTSPAFQKEVSTLTPKGERNWIEVILDAIRDLLNGRARTQTERLTDEVVRDMVLFVESARPGLFGLPRMDQLLMQPHDARRDSRFYELTEDLGDDVEAWKAANPEKYAELERMRADVLKDAGYDVGPVWHHGSFDIGEDAVPVVGEGGMHFGTRAASEARAYGKLVDGFISSIEVEYDEDLGAWFWRADGIDSYDLDEDGFQSEQEARLDAETYAEQSAEYETAAAEDLGSFTKVFLSVGNTKKTTDQGASWVNAISNAKKEGHESITYVNQFEDKGSISYVVFDPTQIKSAEPILRDDNGDLIPPSRWGDKESPDIRFQPAGQGPVTPEQDAAYLAAVERGDMETAQRMVDEAAMAAGFRTGPVYHSTNADFTTFAKTMDIGFHFGTADQAAYKSQNKRTIRAFISPRGVAFMEDHSWANPQKMLDVAEQWVSVSDETRDLVREWNRLKKVMDLRDTGDMPFDKAEEVFYARTRAWRDKAIEAFSSIRKDFLDYGISAIRYDNRVEGEGQSWILLDPRLIKSADPVTYDNDGNVIPLSRRFNPESDDIRFQQPEAAEQPPTDIRALAESFNDTGDPVDLDYDEIARMTEGLDPVNTEAVVRSEVNRSLAHRAGLSVLADVTPEEADRLLSVYQRATSGSTLRSDIAFYRTNPTSLERLRRYLSAALNRMWERLKLRFDHRTSVYVERLTRALAKAERGYRVGGEVKPFDPVADDVMMQPADGGVGDANTARFNELTRDLPAFPTQADLDAWRESHPDEYQELKAMRERVLRGSGYEVGRAYHSTKNPRQITKFVVSARDALGAHFGLTRRQAIGPEGRHRRVGGGVSLYETFLSAKNPIRLEDRGTWSSDRVVPQINKQLGTNLPMNASRDLIISTLRDRGYDSAIYENMHEGREGDEAIIVFSPEQIKSTEPLSLSPEGRLITPDQWGDTESPDIRFQPPAERVSKVGYLRAHEGSHVLQVKGTDKPFVSEAGLRGFFQRIIHVATTKNDLIDPMAEAATINAHLNTAVQNHARKLGGLWEKAVTGITDERAMEILPYIEAALGSTAPLLTNAEADRINSEVQSRLEASAARRDARIAEIEDQFRKKNIGASERDASILAAREISAAEDNATFDYERDEKIRSEIAEASERRRLRDLAQSWLDANEAEVGRYTRELRDTITDAQVMLKDLLGEDHPMHAVIDRSQGIYLVRSFAVHQNPELIDSVLNDAAYEPQLNALRAFFEDQLVERTVERLRRRPGLANATDAELEAMAAEERVDTELRRLRRRGEHDSADDDTLREVARLNVAEQAQTMVEDFLLGHKAGTSVTGTDSEIKRNVHRFMHKRNLDPAILDALLEIKDPVFNAANTFVQVAGLVRQEQILRILAKQGTDAGLFVSKDTVEADPRKYHGWKPLVSASNSRAWAPLATLHAEPHVVEAFQSVFHTGTKDASMTADKMGENALRFIRSVAGASLGVTTLGNPGYYTRNVVGNLIMLARQGYFPDADLARSFRASWNSAFSRLTDDAEFDAFVNEMTALGILSNGAHIQYVRELIRTSVDNPSGAMAAVESLVERGSQRTAEAMSKAKDVLKAGYEMAANFSQVTEEFSTLFAMMKNIEMLTEAGYGTTRQIYQEAARRTKLTMPSKSEASQSVAAFTKHPVSALLAPFLRFKTEIFRTYVNTYRQAVEDIRSDNEVIRRHGRRTLASAMTVDAVVTVAMPFILAAMSGIGDDEDRLIRAAMPAYDKNTNFWFVRGTDGKLYSYNLSYVNPGSLLGDPFVSMLRSTLRGDVQEIPEIGWRVISSEVFGENIVAGKVNDVRRNKNESTGLPIWQETDDWHARVTKSVEHIGSSFVPAVVRNTDKMIDAMYRPGKEDEPFLYTPLGVLIGQFLPTKARPLNPEDLGYRAFSSAAAANRQLWQITAPLKNPMGYNPTDVADVYDDLQRANYKIQRDIHRYIEGMKGLGVPMRRIAAKASGQHEGAGISRERFGMAVRGEGRRKVLDSGTLDKIGKINPAIVEAWKERQKEYPEIFSVK